MVYFLSNTNIITSISIHEMFHLFYMFWYRQNSNIKKVLSLGIKAMLIRCTNILQQRAGSVSGKAMLAAHADTGTRPRCRSLHQRLRKTCNSCKLSYMLDISWYNTTWYWTQYSNFKSTTLARKTATARRNVKASHGCLSRVILGKWLPEIGSALYFSTMFFFAGTTFILTYTWNYFNS